ncbi:MAG: PspC domain-containing protein [Nitriliruptorales bacterium]|nr:PspC domain-containing protein [Nitriliruptorales bacterium]
MNDTMTGDTTSQAPPPPPPGRPPLRRRTDDRMIAGVASGLARTLGIETAVARILFVVALFVGGLGIPLYLAGWLLIPEDGSDEAVVSDVVRSRGAQFWIGIVLLVIGVLALADQASDVTGDLAWPLVLIGIGVVLWRSSREGDAGPAGAPGPRIEDRPAGGEEAPPRASQDAAAAPAPPPPAHAPPPASGGGTPPPATDAAPTAADGPPRGDAGRRSVLGRVTIALALITVGVLWLGDAAGLVDLSFRDGAAVALGVIGLGLVVGTWLGRARWLIVPGLILVPVVVLATTLHGSGIRFGAGVGERSFTPAAVSELADPYELTAGELRLDLTELELGDGPVEIGARVGAGQIVVLVPHDAALEIDADVAMGEITILGEGPSGAGLDHSFNRTGDRGPIVLDLHASLGEIVVDSVPAPNNSQEDQ